MASRVTGRTVIRYDHNRAAAAPILLFLLLVFALCCCQAGRSYAAVKELHLSVLLVGNNRQETVDGFREGMRGYAEEKEIAVTIDEVSAGGDREKLPDLAQQIVAAGPDIAIAAGGIEADALFAATREVALPVVFLSVSSPIDRGLVESMASSGNNLTGVDTNDTDLTAKRLWFISKMLPQAKNVLCFHVPSIVPSGRSIAVAKKSCEELGLHLRVIEVESQDEIVQGLRRLDPGAVDVILLLPVAPTDKAVQPVILPWAMTGKVPIFGHGGASVKSGAFAAYAGSRYENGRQAARLVHKIVHGTVPSQIPVETPQKLQLTINRSMVQELGLELPRRVWRMADEIVEISF